MHNIKISNAGGLPSFDRYFMMVSMSTVFVANTTEKNYPPLSGPIFSDAQRSLLSRGLCHKNPSLSMTYQIVQCPLRGRLSTNFMLWRMTDLMKMISTEIFSNDI